MRIRKYEPRDRAACLAVCRSAVPKFIGECEIPLFEAFLDKLPGPYFVAEVGSEAADGQVIACAGYALSADQQIATLCWGLVHVAHHGTGVGRRLLEARLTAIRGTPGVRRIELGTSQHTFDFFAKFGFETVDICPDGFAPGLDRYDMRLLLTGD